MRQRGVIWLFSLCFLLVGCQTDLKQDAFLNGGVFHGECNGYSGELTVEVEVKNGAIIQIQAMGINPDFPLALSACHKTIDAIISNQSLRVDQVAGATVTVQALVKSVESALNGAGIETGYFYPVNEDELSAIDDQEVTYDVVVVGGGAAGLAASVEAAMQGRRVILVEKLPFAGGNTALSGGEMSVPEYWMQGEFGIHDQTDIMVQDMIAGSHGTGSASLVRILCENINDTVSWMEEVAGVTFQNRVYQVSGHSVPRTIIPNGLGAGVVERLLAIAEEHKVVVLYNAKATELVVDDGRVVGVEVVKGDETYPIYGSERIVLATGGYGANVEMREFYNTRWASLGEEVLTSNSPGITGDGILMAEKIGAKLIDMEYIQLYPYNNPASGKHYYLDNIRTRAGAFFVNKEGRRFVNEDEVRDVVAGKILDQTAQTSYEVFNQSIIDILADDPVAMEEVEHWLKQGVLIKRDTIEACADYFGINKFSMADTLENYNAYIRKGTDPEFGRLMDFGTLDNGPYYMLEGVPSVHYTMGGVAIDEDAKVLDKEGTVIPGLYAAGEVTGGIHGENRLGACAVPDALVFGRIAGGYEPVRKKSGQ